MSRLAKKNIGVPNGVTISLEGERVLVKGPKGEAGRLFPKTVKIEKAEDGSLKISFSKTDTLQARADLGSTAAHLRNMITGVVSPYTRKLILEGVGFKSEVSGDTLKLALGFSHPVKVKIPKGLTVTAEKNVISVSGVNLEETSAFAARLRSEKKPEPYKGKGFRYDGEVIRRKEGKKTV